MAWPGLHSVTRGKSGACAFVPKGNKEGSGLASHVIAHSAIARVTLPCRVVNRKSNSSNSFGATKLKKQISTDNVLELEASAQNVHVVTTFHQLRSRLRLRCLERLPDPSTHSVQFRGSGVARFLGKTVLRTAMPETAHTAHVQIRVAP